MTWTNDQPLDFSSIIAALAAIISLASLVATIAVARHQNWRNDQSRTAHLDLGVQGYLEDGNESTEVSVTNAGPAPASEVLVFLRTAAGLETGQGVMRLEPGHLHTFKYGCDTSDLDRVTLTFVDGRGSRIERSWTPSSKSWPLIPWTLRAMRRRSSNVPRA